MRQETKGKIFVGMIVSILAFGFATGAGVFMNTNPLGAVGIMNLTKQSEFPTIISQPNNATTSQSSKSINTTPTEQNYVEPKTNTNTNTNKSPSNSNSTSNSTN